MTTRGVFLRVALVLSVAGMGVVRADLSKARAETRLDKRANLALDNAEAQCSASSAAYRAGDWDKAWAALDEVRESVELADVSLKAMGRNPRGSTPHKRLEIRTRKLLRVLEDFRNRVNSEERVHVGSVITAIQKIHDDVLEAIMAGKKRR